MDKVEYWIRQKLATAVAAGNGQWSGSPPSAFGKPIYHVTAGSMTLTLSELGFSYNGSTPAVARKYDEVEALQLMPLRDIMKLHGNLDAPTIVKVVMCDASPPAEMRWPLRVYSNVATVLDRIVRELA